MTPPYRCHHCGGVSTNPRFCSRSCSSASNNATNPKRKLTKQCKGCDTLIKSSVVYCDRCRAEKLWVGKPTQGRPARPPRICPTCQVHFQADRKYCSSTCIPSDQWMAAYHEYIERWKRGEVDGSKKGSTVSGHLRRYLFEKYESKCSQCGWCEVNPATNRTPLHVDHVDGDWSNNRESNLRLLCPNCHSLTTNYGSLNRGHGRPDRRVEKGGLDPQTLRSALPSK